MMLRRWLSRADMDDFMWGLLDGTEGMLAVELARMSRMSLPKVRRSLNRLHADGRVYPLDVTPDAHTWLTVHDPEDPPCA